MKGKGYGAKLKIVMFWLLLTLLLIWVEYNYVDTHDVFINLDYILIPILTFVAVIVFFTAKAKYCKKGNKGYLKKWFG
jgi:hypothetical protein